ncbi:MAG: primosomal protein N' [Rickettsiales bacterium]|nr:primosomal protein N' [Rickettsiales bacterium]
MNPPESTITLSEPIVEVLLPRPFSHGFDYAVPDGMNLRVGDYVQVPFGTKSMIGVVWGEGRGDVEPHKCKPITTRYEHVPPLPALMRSYVDWVADYTLSDKGSVLKMVLASPKALTEPPTETIYRLSTTGADYQSEARAAVANYLKDNGANTAKHIKQAVGASQSILASMVKDSQLVKDNRIIDTAPKPFDNINLLALDDQQRQAAEKLHQSDKFHVNLLDGVTGSGKTEVYFDVIARHLSENDDQIMVLLPEIALATQWMERFEARFGQKPILWHSSVTEAQRKKNWLQVAKGQARLVVGARSALFLPYKSLGLIIVDEEHEASYKQDDGVLYHARDMAIAKAKLEDIPIILATATPSLETVVNVEEGKYSAVHLESRFGAARLPEVSLIDITADKPERGCFITPTLHSAIQKTLADGHQTMLFLNRRGYAPLLLCRNCGYRFACDQCSAWMVQHQHNPRLECHHCGYRKSIPHACPECDSKEDLVPCGPGVERVEEEVKNYYPNARITTLTSDQSNVQETIERITNHETDIIIGTQMLAKGHHFPHLTTVGVVDGDLGLKGGDLRASEHTYQLLHQLAGRAGREAIQGHVYIQTTLPEHPVMQALTDFDRVQFQKEEMHMRQQGEWPPYGRLAALLFDGRDAVKVTQTARALVQAAPKDERVRLLGPAPAPLSKLRNQYRVRVLVKSTKQVSLQRYIKLWLTQWQQPRDVRLKIDIDPYNFL